MKGDIFLCKSCRRKWENIDDRNPSPSFCSNCYSEDIINLSKQERLLKRKDEKESEIRENKVKQEKLRRKLRRDVLKARELKNRYSRSKKR